jgi:hypothetical protein
MTCRPQPLQPVPKATAATVQAALPTGKLYVDLIGVDGYQPLARVLTADAADLRAAKALPDTLS